VYGARQVKILYIVTAYPRATGDVITPWLVETIDRLAGRGVTVEVLAPSYRGLGDQVFGGTRVHRFRYAPAVMERLTHDQTAPDRIRERPWYLGLVPGYVAAGSVAAARLARSGGFDAVHAFWPLPHGLFGLAAKRHAGTPLISTFFGVELTWLRSQLPFLAPVARRIVRGSDAVTVISTYTAREVESLVPGTRVRTIPFGAAVSAPTEERGDRGVGPAAGVGGHRLLFVGRLVERKGVAYLLEAVSRLRAARDVRLVVVGDGPLRPELERRAARLGLEGHVEFLGFVSDERLRSEYATCDICVLPAVRDTKGDVEGLGVVLIEALLHRRPVVASDSGGITDIVIDGRTGLLVPPGDADALAAALARLMDDPREAARLAREGHDFVTERFGWDRIIDDLVELYRSTARAGPQRPSSPAPPASE
jgi:glycosyltransferase involved in cell wall biosynthesis